MEAANAATKFILMRPNSKVRCTRSSTVLPTFIQIKSVPEYNDEKE